MKNKKIGTEGGISYIVPVYNESGAIESTISRLMDALEGLDMPFEVIVVDDGSQDGSGDLAAKVSGVQVICHPSNTGYGSGLKTGIRNAQYEWIGIVDADGTYEIERLSELIDQMKEGFDMVVAERENVLKTDKPIKKMFRFIYRFVINVLTGKTVSDPNSGFRVFRKDVALTFFPFLCNAFSFTTSITLFALGEGYFVKYVPMQYSKREGKTKVRHFRDSLRTTQLIIQGISYFNPIKFYILLAFFFVVIVAGPALALALLDLETIAFYYFWTGAIVSLLAGIAVMVDTLRIAAQLSSGDEI